MNIPFNHSYRPSKVKQYLVEVLAQPSLSGDGSFTQKCHQFFKTEFGFSKALLTTSCTHSLEMAALLCQIQPGDEVIMPSYTFVSTANPFILRGAKPVFADSRADHPNLDIEQVEALITPRTRAIIPVHYGGVACAMDELKALCQKNHLYLIEDAAQGVNAFYKDQPLGALGDVGALSFHDTKNLSSGEGGLTVVNRPEWYRQAEIVREKGTNRSAFFRGEVDKYGWVAPGSSYLPSDLLAALLWSQLEELDRIQAQRNRLWLNYQAALQPLAEQGHLQLPNIPDYAQHNAHVFYLVLPTAASRNRLIKHLKQAGIQAPFHYLALHQSPYFKARYHGPDLPHSVRYTDCLLRLPLYFQLSPTEQDYVIEKVLDFFK